METGDILRLFFSGTSKPYLVKGFNKTQINLQSQYGHHVLKHTNGVLEPMFENKNILAFKVHPVKMPQFKAGAQVEFRGMRAELLDNDLGILTLLANQHTYYVDARKEPVVVLEKLDFEKVEPTASELRLALDTPVPKLCPPPPYWQRPIVDLKAGTFNGATVFTKQGQCKRLTEPAVLLGYAYLPAFKDFSNVNNPRTPLLAKVGLHRIFPRYFNTPSPAVGACPPNQLPEKVYSLCEALEYGVNLENTEALVKKSVAAYLNAPKHVPAAGYSPFVGENKFGSAYNYLGPPSETLAHLLALDSGYALAKKRQTVDSLSILNMSKNGPVEKMTTTYNASVLSTVSEFWLRFPDVGYLLRNGVGGLDPECIYFNDVEKTKFASTQLLQTMWGDKTKLELDGHLLADGSTGFAFETAVRLENACAVEAVDEEKRKPLFAASDGPSRRAYKRLAVVFNLGDHEEFVVQAMRANDADKLALMGGVFAALGAPKNKLLPFLRKEGLKNEKRFYTMAALFAADPYVVKCTRTVRPPPAFSARFFPPSSAASVGPLAVLKERGEGVYRGQLHRTAVQVAVLARVGEETAVHLALVRNLAAQLDETFGVKTRRVFNKDVKEWRAFKAEPIPVVAEPAAQVLNTTLVFEKLKAFMPKSARLVDACADADSLYYLYRNLRRKQNPPFLMEALPLNADLSKTAESARGNRTETALQHLKYCVAVSLLEREEDAPQLFNLWKHNLKTPLL